MHMSIDADSFTKLYDILYFESRFNQIGIQVYIIWWF